MRSPVAAPGRPRFRTRTRGRHPAQSRISNKSEQEYATPATASGRAAAAPGWKVVATGLDNPRQLAFSGNGTLYVVEAGKGGRTPCVPDPEDPKARRCFT